MSQSNQPTKSQHRIFDDANQLLRQLCECHVLLKQLNQAIESRSFSTRLHGQFDHELKKSQQLIHKLSALLRSYHSSELSSPSSSLDSKAIDGSFILAFKDACIDIEREWRIGTARINHFYAATAATARNSESGYHSDTGATHTRSKRDQHKPRSLSRSPSPIHSFSFSNPIESNPKYTKFKVQPQASMETNIAAELIPRPCYQEEVLSQQIRDIADDLQYLLQINAQVQQLVHEQDEKIANAEQKVESAKENVASGRYYLGSVPHSYLAYGVLGGITMALIGAPIALASAGIKAAVGGAIGFGTIGVFGGTLYAKKANENMENDECDHDERKEKLIASESSDHEEEQKKQVVSDVPDHCKQNVKPSNVIGFQTKPRKRTNVYRYLNDNNNCHDNDDANIEDWDARM